MTLLRILPALAVLLAVAASAQTEEPEKDLSQKPIARMVHYSGDVQGVGFRATAAEIAKGYPVTGWVKNLTDGRVQLLVEGSETAVPKFLDAVRTHWKKNITREQVEERPPTGRYKSFAVVR